MFVVGGDEDASTTDIRGFTGNVSAPFVVEDPVTHTNLNWIAHFRSAFHSDRISPVGFSPCGMPLGNAPTV
jgi:hypothetical protein